MVDLASVSFQRQSWPKARSTRGLSGPTSSFRQPHSSAAAVLGEKFNPCIFESCYCGGRASGSPKRRLFALFQGLLLHSHRHHITYRLAALSDLRPRSNRCLLDDRFHETCIMEPMG